ncbi:3H domain-containing protein [Methanobacterium alcaliphilum]|uniref:3H domain-containing protein n=1 Tax=Methanobacterium alcaliphilum TaxID=392018 RepID=UPI00200AA3FA|nr:3H domain-containing protein [Methanobacterium alcaliphilum]MCK9151226.1 AAA family ATPase [Methanobacterium alcaliphilum]
MKKPYVILIGSASGIGKSTIASELAKELGIKHLIETDFIREIVRGIIGPDYAPALHKSSFDAYTTLRDKERFKDNKRALINAGFEEHASFVIPAIEKVIKRAVDDSDDVVIEGVHLVPGLVNMDKFKNDASIHFFILSADEDVHKERFVKRAMKIKRGGKHLEYFKENRTIHNYLVAQATEHNIPVINNQDLESSKKRMLSLIREICKVMILKHPVDSLEDEIDIVLEKYGGRIVDVSYFLPGSGEPLKRNVNVYDPLEAKRFVKHLKENPKRKKDLEKLYELSDNVHSHKICAPDKETLQRMIEDLGKSGFIFKKDGTIPPKAANDNHNA